MIKKPQMSGGSKLFLIIFVIAFLGGILIISKPWETNSLPSLAEQKLVDNYAADNASEDYTPKYSGKVSIVSATCADAVDLYGNKVYRIDVEGNANASVGAHLDIVNNPLSGHPVDTCSSWSISPNEYEYTCRRNENNPSNTTWTHVITDFSILQSEFKTGKHVYISAFLWMIDDSIDEGYHVLLDQADYDIACLPVSNN